jgi:hypothetical protein
VSMSTAWWGRLNRPPTRRELAALLVVAGALAVVLLPAMLFCIARAPVPAASEPDVPASTPTAGCGDMSAPTHVTTCSTGRPRP